MAVSPCLATQHRGYPGLADEAVVWSGAPDAAPGAQSGYAFGLTPGNWLASGIRRPLTLPRQSVANAAMQPHRRR